MDMGNELREQPYRVEVKVKGESGFYPNGLRFPTEADAQEYAQNLWSRWLAVEQYHIVKAGFDDEPDAVVYTTEQVPA
jgi:hypothetical protein